MKENRNSFGGTIGFVLAAAASAVGLGNIWRFPYLAAKNGGGLFLAIYLVLALTFGFSLLTVEVAIGRKTKQSALTAYSALKKGWKPLGVISCLVPFLILPYYCVIGGWVLKYLIVFITGQGLEAAQDGFFTGFITGDVQPIVMFAIFLVICAFIVFRGVNKGIEASSKVLMPLLLLICIGISVFSLTISHTDSTGETRTGLQGFQIFVIPSFEGLTVKGFFTVVMDAMGQLFYSLSVAMGIMIAYGSYVRDDANMVKSINQIEIFDTIVAFLAGMMIIPAVYVFMGKDGMAASGPSLMFVTLPKVFMEMGPVLGRIIGILFFAMVLFAAATSAVSVMEAVVASFMDEFKISRNRACLIEFLCALVLGVLVCLGYNKLYFELKLPNGSVGQILDVMDYISNSVLMPVVSIATCILVGWVLKPDLILKEVQKNNEKFGRGGLLVVMVKFIAPVLLFLLLLKSLGILTII